MLQPTPQESALPNETLVKITVDKEVKLQEVPRTYTHDEVESASLEYFNGDSYAASVFAGKYALRDAAGTYYELTPADMHRRIARELARAEAKYPNPMSEQEIFDLLDRFKYIVPQGSPMSGIGNDFQLQSLSNCFVIDQPWDSYGGIFLADQEQAQIMKRRGGVGFDVSPIRPSGLPTTNAARTTDGTGVFMDRFSRTCKEVAQNGRRGALMLSCDIHHPDIRTFISIKNELSHCKKCGHGERTKVTGANVSVRLSDEFLEAVEKGENYQLRWPVDQREKPAVEEWIDARELWDEIMKMAHESGEPGLLFWGNAKKYTPSDIYEKEGFGSVSTNPCGEIILSPNDSCRLMVVNLTSFVKNEFTDDAVYDWEHMAEVVQKAQRLMDDLIDLEIEQIDKIIDKVQRDPEDEAVKMVELGLWKKIRKAAVKGRRTGLGITGLGDAVAMMNLRYASDEGLSFIEEIYKNLAVNSYTSSIIMAKERGAFEVCDVKKEEGHPFIEHIKDALDAEMLEMYKQYGRRNISNTTTAPTGSVSAMTQTSSGIEPVYAMTYMRRKKINPNDENVRVDFTDATGDSWQHYKILHHAFARWCKVTGRDYEEVLGRLERRNKAGDLDPDMSDVDASPYGDSLANDIDWTRKLEAQGRAQSWVCHAISNTTNLPSSATVDDVKNVYMTAWRTGCKGVTVYRDGSRDGVLVQDMKEKTSFTSYEAPKRTETLECDIHRALVKSGDEHLDWIFFVGKMEGKPYEIFGGFSDTFEIPKKIEKGWIIKRSLKTKGAKYDLYFGDEDDPSKIKDIVKVFDNPNQGVFTRIISTALRHGTPVQYVVEQLLRDRENDMFTFAKGMARILKNYIPDGTKVTTEKACPGCGTEGALSYQEGCMQCTLCEWGKCG